MTALSAAAPDAGVAPHCMANVGNLMQHWTWAQALTALQQPGCLAGAALHLVDAHAMAPFSVIPAEANAAASAAPFYRVRAALPGSGSPYERAWAATAGRAGGYPSTAVLTTYLWRGSLSLLLCDTDQDVVRRLRPWTRKLPVGENRGPTAGPVDGTGQELHGAVLRKAPEIYEGDWRVRFDQGIAADGDLVFVSFDPKKFDRNTRKKPRLATLYPEDLDRTVRATAEVRVPILVLLNQYTARADSSPVEVRPLWDAHLNRGGFRRLGRVEVDDNRMAAVYARGLPEVCVEAVSTAVAQGSFDRWLARFSRT